jgi:hypothetical protein
VWAAVLRAGAGAAAGPWTSLWLAGVVDRMPERPDVVLPARRQLRADPGIRASRRRRLATAIDPAAGPPRLRVEEALLDAVRDLDRPAAVLDLVLRAVQRRLTTAARIRERLADRRAHPWRTLLTAALADADAGVRSMLEHRWLHDVERAHGLPPSSLNRPDREVAADGTDAGRRLRDAEFVTWGLVVELDGREFHPGELRFRDRRRDNRVTATGRRTLRYGWREVAGDPCGVAAEVAQVLRLAGWAGTPRPCGPACGLRSTGERP